MKKIIGILVALGLVLSLAVMAVPVAADVTQPQVSLDNYCACNPSGYNITFNITASLTEGYNKVCVKFPAGTTVPTEFEDDEIFIEGVAVFEEEITVTGTQVCFLVPEHLTTTNNPILVEFDDSAGIRNPCTEGKYQLEVWTDRPADATPVKSAKYEIIPCLSDYVFVWDSGPTYPGIAEGFVPPFKACGQNFTNAVNIGNETDPKWMNAFNLTFEADPVGCNAPCDTVDIYMSLVASPQFPCADVDPVSKVTINLTGASTLNTTVLTYDTCTMEKPAKTKIYDDMPLAKNTSETWEGLIHFDTVGEYEICFWAECPGGTTSTPCQPPTTEDPEKLVEKCFDFKVYQWKEADFITLQEKWNLISLPLVPLEEGIPVEDVLASIPKADRDNILSIWYYDTCEDEWLVWGNGQSSLKTLEDGKAYWVRVAYPLAGCGNITWWTWGTYLPVPPASPAEYPVCEGWNMVGVIGWWNVAPSTYLWNWSTPNPVVYGWQQGCWNAQTWYIVPWTVAGMNAGEGYWVAFPADGAVYVP